MNIFAQKVVPLTLILLSGGLVAVADGFIKKASVNQSNLVTVLLNPLMIWVGIIYLFAIGVFGLVFIRRWDLGIVGLMQIVIYAVAVVLGGVLFFHERLTIIHEAGMILALIAVILMNL